MIPTCSPTWDDNEESKKNKGMAEEVGVKNVLDTTPRIF